MSDVLPGATHKESCAARWAAPLLIVSVILIAYGGSFGGPFIFDDVISIRDNPQVRDLLLKSGQTTLAGRPLLLLSFWLDFKIAGLSVAAYHITNLLIHSACALLLYGIVRRNLGRREFWGERFVTSAPWLAAVIAAMWAAHPLTTASVTYIVQRAESLAGLFYLATIYCVIRASAAGRTSTWWASAAVAACAAGMASKEVMATAPLMALLYDRTFLSGSFKAAMRKGWRMYLGMALTWIIVLIPIAGGARSNTIGASLGIAWEDYARTQLGVVAHYFHLCLDPRGLCLDYYGWPIANHWSDVSAAGWGVLVLPAVTIAAMKFKPWLGFMGAWLFLILLPSSSFVPIVTEIAADHRMYLPLAGVVALVVVGGWSIVGRMFWQSALFVAMGVLMGCCALTIARNRQYRSAEPIWRDVTVKDPGNARGFYNLGLALLANGSDARQAADAFQSSLALENYGRTTLYLGDALARAGESANALRVYTEALKEHTELAFPLHMQRGKLLLEEGDAKGAADDFTAAALLNPDDPEPRHLLGIAEARGRGGS